MKRSPMHVLLQPLRAFARMEAASGLMLMAATVAAMLIANSSLGTGWTSALDHPLRIGAGALSLDKPVLLWINDALMVLFFIVVGLELKREMVIGHLSSLRTASHSAAPSSK